MTKIPPENLKMIKIVPKTFKVTKNNHEITRMTQIP